MKYFNLRNKRRGTKMHAFHLYSRRHNLGQIVDLDELLWHHKKRDARKPLKRKRI